MSSVLEQPPLTVVTLESRNAVEMARLLSRHGCIAISAPSMREIALTDQHEALAFGERLMGDGVDVLVLLTGVGTRVLVDALCTRWDRAQVVAALSRVQLVCRGPKPTAVLKALGLRPQVVAPEPNTWRELVAALDQQLPVTDRELVLQEYGRPNAELLAALKQRGARVQTLAIYAWAMPEDLSPLKAAVEILCERRADALLFTSGQQLEHLLTVARDMGRQESLQRALREWVLCVSIGPVTSEALTAAELPVDLEPAHPKMGHLASVVGEQGASLVIAKRARMSSARHV